MPTPLGLRPAPTMNRTINNGAGPASYNGSSGILPAPTRVQTPAQYSTAVQHPTATLGVRGMNLSGPPTPVNSGMMNSLQGAQANYNTSSAMSMPAPQAQSFDPQDPNNAALAGYMAG